MKIAIIQHENDYAEEAGNYFIELIASCWREAGHEVIFVKGVDESVQADVALLHVNLSVVPNQYVQYAKQFPVALNTEIRDIRKQSISDQLVSRHDDYNGPVIVKTDLNCAGLPEANIYNEPIPKSRSVMRFWRFFIRRARNLAIKMKMVHRNFSRLVQTEYRETFQIFKHKSRVPTYIWSDGNWIVEKFIPEKENSKFAVRNAYFFGNKMICFKNVSSDPIVKDEVEGVSDIVTIPDEIIQYRNRIGLDYGKIDFVMYKGRPVVFDVAKTLGGAFGKDAAQLLAAGVEDYMILEKKYA